MTYEDKEFRIKGLKMFIRIILLSSLFYLLIYSFPAFSFDLNSPAYSLNAENKDVKNITEARKIGELLDDLEKNWNEHKSDGVVKYYSDDFVNGDGLGLEAVKKLTHELWEAYSDIQTKSEDRTIRVYGEYATVDSTDLYSGTSSKERNEVGAKGEIRALVVGQMFLKKFGPAWKITSDKTILEKVSIGYGIGSELVDKNKIKLSVPEQVASSQQYTATLDFDLPLDIKPVAAISKELLIYPQVTGEDKFRLITESKLEKLLSANKISKNELITATIGLTGGPLKPKLLGLVFLSRRVNVIPVSEQSEEVSIIKTPAKSALNKKVDSLDFNIPEGKQINEEIKNEKEDLSPTNTDKKQDITE